MTAEGVENFPIRKGGLCRTEVAWSGPPKNTKGKKTRGKAHMYITSASSNKG